MTYFDKCLLALGMLLAAMAIVTQAQADRAAYETRTSPVLSPRPAIVRGVEKNK